jgi:outer membrane protein OmpA-like peptidoglycan-associated protein
VTDAESGSILQGAQVTITVPASGNGILAGTTNEEGRVDSGLENVKIGDQLKINVTISKEGYLTKTVDVTLNITQPGVINIHEMMDASIGKMEVGVDLATLIDIKPIYFDLGKSLIRKDAAKELDKIVKVMNDYPTMVVELGSHTDCRGSIASNSALSDRRAKASAEYIKARITNPERIYGKGYGESQLKVDCPCEGTVKSTCPESEHQKNRRTEFLIIKM